MPHLKKLTLLHSNDMHGDFLAEEVKQKLVGGISLLSGYINQVRSQEKNVIYAIAGDMFKGSVIDSDYKGFSTIDIMNMLAPDIVTIGNHEADYGLAHMLFLEKCAKFPIINANLHIKNTGTRLFTPCRIIELDGMKILFIGIITEEILAQAKKDASISAFINVEEAAGEVERICDGYRSIDIDFTVLLTHIGIEEDKKLAALLNPACGVDVIIGGHSHTVMEQPLEVNNILIAQAGTGTDYIGRFDIDVDTDTNSTAAWSWSLVPIDDQTCPRDEAIENLISGYKQVTDQKYNRLVTRLARTLTHPKRNQETELGNLFCDLLTDSLGLDIMLLGSGSIRVENMGPLITLGQLQEGFSFNENIYLLKLSGAQLRQAMLHLLRDEMFSGATEFYQLPGKVRLVYSRSKHQLQSFTFNGQEITAEQIFTVGLQSFHYMNAESFLGLSKAELGKLQTPRVIALSDFQVAEEYLESHQNLDARVDGRITICE
jgi:5'-nucleotidase/UDP-sugar diphosphatase